MNPFKVLGKTKEIIRQLAASKALQSRAHKRTFQRFAEKIGLVYFGYVDQRNDEHSLIRGMTVSTKHRDNHYCIGSFESYDITVVERNDVIHFPNKPSLEHNWTIMTFDLHRAVDLPHVVLGSHTHSETFYAQFFAKYAHFVKVIPADSLAYPPAFLDKYTLFTKADHALSAERLFHPSLAAAITEQFNSITLEIYDGAVYLYSEQRHPTPALLDAMLTRGLWLARVIDSQHQTEPTQ